MQKKILLIISIVVFPALVFSQAGTGTYKFLDLPVSSRMSALGGTNVSLRDNDLNFAFQNPALLTSQTDNMLGVNMANYLADIKFGSAMYSHNFGKKDFLAIGVQYIDYGSLLEADELGVLSGAEFTAKDMAMSIIYARPINKKFTVGGTLKPVSSAYEQYSSFGVALDAGVNYNDSANLFSAGFVVRNFGTQFKGYYSDETGQHFESLPLDVQLGLTKKLAHAPFRFSLTLHNLQKFDLSYEETNQSTTTDQTSSSSTSEFVDMAFRHTVFGLEFVPSKNFYLAASYNHRRNKELQMSGFKSMTGWSFGGGIKLSKFQVGFGMSQFLVGNYTYQFSISTSLNEFRL